MPWKKTCGDSCYHFRERGASTHVGEPYHQIGGKKSSLLEIFKDANEITKGLLQTLISNKRIAMLQEVAFKYIILHEKLKGEEVAYVTTAVPLTSDLEKKILETVTKATGNKVTLENKIDESIIGGFVLRVGDTQYDASIANKLNGLKREFTNSL